MIKSAYLIIAIIFVCLNSLLSQDVLLQGWYWNYPKTAQGQNWTDSLDEKLEDLASRGITHIWLPPMSRASFGSNSNGYDPKDLYDLGGYGLGPTGFGTRTQLDTLISHIKATNMKAVADVVYNHRDGGKAENNISVEGWIENYNCTKKGNGDNPYPSDRFRCILPLGGMNGAGTYYFKMRSRTRHPDFNDKPYKFYVQTNKTGYQNLPAVTEFEPNGGGNCGQGNNTVALGVDMLAWTDISGGCDDGLGGCGIDEFAVTIGAGDYNATDTLFIYFNNVNGQYSDHYVFGLWSGARAMDIQSELIYQTYTDFTGMPSGRGWMNHTNFKPNGNPTQLNGDWDYPYFFYDYDQNVASTRQELIDWSQWLMDSIHIEGLRMDAVKHFDPAFLSALFDSLYNTNQTPDLVVGEFYDGNPYTLKNWVNSVEGGMSPPAASATKVRVFDFALRNALKDACDQYGYDARNVFSSGIVDGAAGNADQAITFLNNHDFRDFGQPVYNDPELGYAYLLTNPRIGIPCIFYPDYFGIDLPEGPDAKLKGDIDILLNIKQKYIDNATNTVYINSISNTYPNPLTFHQGSTQTSLIYEVVDAMDMVETLIAINYSGDTLEVSFKWAKQLAGSGNFLNERTGKGLNPNINIGADSMITLVVPPRSYGIWNNDDAQSPCGFNGVVYVDKNAIGQNNGSSWQDAFTSLHAAMRIPYLCSDIQEIWVKEGDYLPGVLGDRDENFTIFEPIKLYGGFPLALPNPSLNDRNWQNYPTILNGNIGTINSSDNTYHVLSNYALQDTALLDGFILRNGNANGLASLSEGGGIVNNGKLMLNNCVIDSCKALGEGSGIYNASTLILENTTIQNVTTASSSLYNAVNASCVIETSSQVKK